MVRVSCGSATLFGSRSAAEPVIMATKVPIAKEKGIGIRLFSRGCGTPKGQPHGMAFPAYTNLIAAVG